MSLVKCKECGKEVSNKADNCPSCGAKVKSGFSIIKAIGSVFFVIVVFGIISGVNSGSKTSSPVSALSEQGDLTATDVKFSRGQYNTKVVRGKVVNTTGKKLGYVQVEINLYDKNGTQVGSTLSNINNLEVGGTWDFEAPVLEDRAASAKVAGITSF